ncbi:MAG: AI-2E family transporter, partial [Shewanella sp.]
MAPIFTNAAVGRTLLILLLCAGVFFFIDFLVPALAALIVCFSSWPLYQKLLSKCAGRSALAASIALICIVLGLITPLF